jgi:hypothetical protein
MCIRDSNNAINIYILGIDTWNQGRATGIISRSCVIGGKVLGADLLLTNVLAHEVGHCLGLFHTHHGTIEGGPCNELVNGTNCSTCGDYVCDTPADPFLNFNVNSSCNWNGSGNDSNGDPYAPDTRNFMAYTLPSCMSNITIGQANRIKAAISSSTLLQSTISSQSSGNFITGPDVVCFNAAFYTLQCFPSNANLTYRLSPNLYASSTAPGTLRVSTRSTGNAFIEFYINGSLYARRDIIAVKVNVSDISGPASVCSGAATFTLNNIPTGVEVTWATSPNLSPTSGSGTVATVSAVGTGEAWIEYTISACGQKIRRYINTLNYTQLEGSRYVCAGGSNLYSVDNFEGATYTWQSSPNITLTQISPNVVSANGISDGNGFVRVTISVNNACHSQTRTLNRNVWVGLPTAPIVTQPAGSTPIAPNTYSFTYQKLDLPAVPSTHAIRFASAGAERIVYTVDNLLVRPSLFADLPEGWGILSGTNNNTLSIDTKRMDIGTYTYTIMGQNDCNNNPFADTSPKTTVIVNIVGLDPLRSVQGNVQIYPNPVEDVLHLILESKQEQAVRYELYNPYSQKVASGSFDERCSIDVSKLPKNVYFLHLHYPDGSTEKRQIVVQK